MAPPCRPKLGHQKTNKNSNLRKSNFFCFAPPFFVALPRKACDTEFVNRATKTKGGAKMKKYIFDSSRWLVFEFCKVNNVYVYAGDYYKYGIDDKMSYEEAEETVERVSEKMIDLYAYYNGEEE